MSSEKLDRDQQILNRLARIEHRVDSIDQTSAFALRAEAEKHFNSVMQIFRNSKRLAQVYLAADGTRGVKEIAKHLGMQRQNVGPALKELGREGLLELIDSQGGKDIWSKKALDRTLRVSKHIQKVFSLMSDGKVSAKAKKQTKKV
jgi:DNA-binding MarR family transcriptional regulator